MYRKIGTALLFLSFVLAGCRINTPPQIVSFTASPDLGLAPLVVNFSISATDPDGDALTCRLDFGDGTTPLNFSCGSLVIKTHSYSAGTYTASLTVSDSRGGSISSSKQISATNPPTPSGACPAPGSLSLSVQATPDKEAPSGLGRFDGVAYVPGELLVLKPDKVTLQSTEVTDLEAELGLERLAAPGLDGWIRYRTAAGNEAAVAARILSSGLGSYVQPNYRYEPLYVPNDSHFASDQQQQFNFMQLTQAWDLLLPGGCRPIVGVIDTGVANDHPDLDAHVIFGYDSSDGDDDPYPATGNDHGTMVASIIAAETDNARGMAGTTDNLAYIMPLKVFPNGTSATIADAIDWARQHGVHVLNMSLCLLNDAGTACADLTSNPDAAIENALQAAYSQGIVSLAASGNYNDSFVGYPASSQYTVAVGATNNDNPPERADESDWCPNTNPNCGSGSNYGPDLDVIAPGTSVFGAGIPSLGNPEPYFHGTGTSFASPYAAGVAGLYISQYYADKATLPSPAQVANCLRASAQDLDPAGYDVYTGAGLVRADRVLDTVTNAYGCY